MGEIKKQGVSNSILILLGALIGAFNVLVLYPLILPKEYFGLTNVLVQVSFIASQFGLLGSHISIVKFWNTLKSNYLLFRYLFRNTVVFSIIVLVILFVWKPEIVFEYQDKAVLFTDNYNYLYLMLGFGVVFELFFSISQANLKTSFPIFLKEVFLRIYQTFLLIIYYFEWIGLDSFIMLFVFGYGFIALAVLTYVFLQKSVSKSEANFTIEAPLKKEIIKYSVVNFLTGFSSSIVGRLDVLMIGAILTNASIQNYSLKAVATYTIAVYVTTMIEIPSRGLFSITAPMIARLWNKMDLKEISVIYKKSSINLTIISVLMFVLLWANIDDLLLFVPKYQSAKWVIFILGIAKVFNMCLGVNNNIITNSKHYRIGTYTMLMLIVVTFSTNYVLIPIYGLEGAAIGSLVSIVIYNLVSFFYLYYKYRLQPFSVNTIKVFALGGALFFMFRNIDVEVHYLNVLLKTIAISSVYIYTSYRLKLSLDINDLIRKAFSKIDIN